MAALMGHSVWRPYGPSKGDTPRTRYCAKGQGTISDTRRVIRNAVIFRLFSAIFRNFATATKELAH